jgi:hypothetical protein
MENYPQTNCAVDSVPYKAMVKHIREHRRATTRYRELPKLRRYAFTGNAT